MKVRVIIEADTETGNYDLEFNNVSHPGQGMELSKLYKIMRLVLEDWVDKSAEDQW